MKLVKKLVLILGAAATLVACGGGGSSDVNRWAAYNGTYVGCNGHWQYTVVFSAVGANQATLVEHDDVYAGDGCTGTIAGTLTYPSPLTLTYQSTVSALVSGVGPSPQNLSIDKVQETVPMMTGTLVGTGVVGECVYYPGGQSCTPLSVPATTVDMGIYLTSTTLVELHPTADGYSVTSAVATKQ